MALFCCAKPLSDLVLEAREVGTARDIPVKILPCRVQAIERAADDVIIMSLKLPVNERLQFLAGQYIEFMLKDGKRRAFRSPTRRMTTATCNCTSARCRAANSPGMSSAP
jgi:CDP-4-dehydro-6-deoxyglucose reductase